MHAERARGVTADGGRVRTAVVAAVAVDDVDAAGRARVEHVAEPARVAAADARRHVLPFGARRQAIALAGAPRQPLRIRPRVVHRHADDRLVVRLREAGLAPVALAQQRERTHVAALARRAVRVARERGVLGFRHFVDRDRELVRDGAAADRLRHDDERGAARVAQRFAGAAHLPEPRRRGRDARVVRHARERRRERRGRRRVAACRGALERGEQRTAIACAESLPGRFRRRTAALANLLRGIPRGGGAIAGIRRERALGLLRERVGELVERLQGFGIRRLHAEQPQDRRGGVLAVHRDEAVLAERAIRLCEPFVHVGHRHGRHRGAGRRCDRRRFVGGPRRERAEPADDDDRGQRGDQAERREQRAAHAPARRMRVRVRRIRHEAAIDLVERLQQFFRRLEAVVQRFRERAVDERLPCAVRRGQTRQRVLHVRDRHRERVRAGVRQFAHEHFVGDHADAVEIGTAVELLPARLFRAHVARRSERAPGIRHAMALVARERDAEVGQQRPVGLVEQDVLGLHVAMHDVLRVRVGERLRDRAHDARDLGRLRAQVAMREVAVRQVRHRVVQQTAARAPDLVDRDDVRMIQARDGARLALEAFGQLLRHRVLVREHLQRHLALQRQLDREVDLGHAAFAETAHDAVARDLRDARAERVGDGQGHGVAHGGGRAMLVYDPCAHRALAHDARARGVKEGDDHERRAERGAEGREPGHGAIDGRRAHGPAGRRQEHGFRPPRHEAGPAPRRSRRDPRRAVPALRLFRAREARRVPQPPARTRGELRAGAFERDRRHDVLAPPRPGARRAHRRTVQRAPAPDLAGGAA